MKDKKHRSARLYALHDIAKEVNAEFLNGEVWNVGVTHIDTKKSRYLNRKLGIHKINKLKK